MNLGSAWRMLLAMVLLIGGIVAYISNERKTERQRAAVAATGFASYEEMQKAAAAGVIEPAAWEQEKKKNEQLAMIERGRRVAETAPTTVDPPSRARPSPPPSSAALICDERTGSPVAAQIGKDVSTLADFTSVSCMAARDSNGCGVICVSSLRTPAAQKLPLLATVLAAGGMRMRSAGIGKFATLSFMDRGAGEARVAYQISAARASEIQAAMKAGRLSAGDLLAITAREFAEKAIPPK